MAEDKYADYDQDTEFMAWLDDMERRYDACYSSYYELLYEAWLAGKESK